MSAHVAIVTGAGGALGHAAALAARGRTVAAVDRNEHTLRDPDGARTDRCRTENILAVVDRG